MNDCSARFVEQLESALTANRSRPSTKTIYRYIKEGLLASKPIDLPKMVRIRKRSKKVTKTNKKTLGKAIEECPEYINDRSEFGHWEIDLVLGKKTKGEAVMLTLVERQTRYALGVKLEDKQFQTINRAVTHLIGQYPIASITADMVLSLVYSQTKKLLKFTLHIPILHMREEQTRTSMASSENMSLKESHLIH
ncbi:hypothetical protein ScFU97_06150 [Streptococcus canis]|nr:hypothetical protein ScFU97_06150 [Streptococcus canis]VTR79736.1 transposase [Streptococcus canis]